MKSPSPAVAGEMVRFVIFENTFAGSPAAVLRRTKFARPCLNFERPFCRQMADAAKRLEAAGTFDEDLHSRR
ncbi:hypothetical protein GGD63_000116 [Bradyrhizobium sp. cir1]|uniref:hypothetical protein n=1 Tax=Bradyrhizobium sp. cir1 TaxID=1445730 RepID=UPI001606C1FA|nr:hypothetical protein [Bradyrhizobium sp. cir1]MBB4367347.1 hypothetical protein [Bradyrhizobium sp. cir1]